MTNEPLPEDLERVLQALGLLTPPKPEPKPTPERKEYPKPWRPSYPGEEPPF